MASFILKVRRNNEDDIKVGDKERKIVMNVPDAGSEIIVQSYKHDGLLHRVWRQNYVLKGTNKIFIGANDKAEVMESDGRVWITREPAISYFSSEAWFNVIGMIRSDGIHYYCNLASPFLYEHNMLKYIDYDLDLKVYPDMTYTLLDEDEYAVHKDEMNYPPALDQILYQHVDQLISMVRQREGPSAPGFIDKWYEQFLTYRQESQFNED